MKFIEIEKPDGSGTIRVSEDRLADPAVAEHYGVPVIFGQSAAEILAPTEQGEAEAQDADEEQESDENADENADADESGDAQGGPQADAGQPTAESTPAAPAAPAAPAKATRKR